MSIFRVAITGHDPVADAEVTLYFEDGPGRSLGPSDTPAHGWVDGRLAEVPSLRREMFSGGTLRSSGGDSRGQLRLINGDGGLDYLEGWAFDGRALVVYYSEDPGAEFPGDWTSVQTATIQAHRVSVDFAEFELRDSYALVDRDLQSDLYAGDNTPPNGLEGVEDLEGKPKPITLGRALNVPAVLVNAPKLIYQVHDGALSAVPQVYDRGILLGSGNAWIDRDIDADGVQRNGIAYGGGRWVAVGNDHPSRSFEGAIDTSDNNGATWAPRSTGEVVQWRDVAYGPWGPMWVVVGDSTRLRSSPDGVTWTARTSQFTGGNAVQVVLASERLGLFIAAGQDGEISTSADGITWTARTSGTGQYLRGLAEGYGRIVAVSQGGEVTASDDGVTWTAKTSGTGLTGAYFWSGAYFDGRLFVAVGRTATGGSEKAIVADSTDGLVWSLRDAAFVGSGAVTTVGLLGGKTADGASIVVGFDGFLGRTETGTVYSAVDSGTTEALFAVAYGDGVFMAVGDNSVARISQPPGTYASEAELLNDTLRPAPGTYKTYLAGGYVRLGAPPDEPVTADVVEGAAPANRTPAQLWVRTLERAGLSGGDWSSSDVTALDAAWDPECGAFTGTVPTPTPQMLDFFAVSGRAWWGVDASGILRLRRIVEPSTATPDHLLGPGDVPLLDLRVLAQSIPTRKATVQYQRNHLVQRQDVAAAVSPERRARLAQEWLDTVEVDAGVDTRHPLALDRVLETAIYFRTDAHQRAEDEMDLVSVARRVLEMAVPYTTATLGIDLGDVVQVVDHRLGLASGKTFLVTSIDPDNRRRVLRIGAWG